MKKIKLEIIGLSYSQTQSGAYALVLGEDKGKRRLPIIIGAFEAQAIAIQLENMTPTRPLTHDLFKSLANAMDAADPKRPGAQADCVKKQGEAWDKIKDDQKEADEFNKVLRERLSAQIEKTTGK